MSIFTYQGTIGDDNLSTFNIQSANPGHSTYNIHSGDGNDLISASIFNRSSVDYVDAGNGDDFIGVNAFNSEYATIGVNGGFGVDKVSLLLSYPVEFKRQEGSTEVTAYNPTADQFFTVLVSDTCEYIQYQSDLGLVYYLTEDLAQGNTKAVGWDEVWTRAYGVNADWALKGLSTIPVNTQPAITFPDLILPNIQPTPLIVPDFGFDIVSESLFVPHMQSVLAWDGDFNINYYIEDYPGDYQLFNGDIVVAYEHSFEDELYIQNIFNALDSLLGLSFTRVFDKTTADIDIYSVQENFSWEDTIVGQVQPVVRGAYWDVLWKDTDGLEELSQLDKYSIIHEIGHALGLSHPNEDPYNSLWNSTDTVMSYNPGIYGFDTFYSAADIATLQTLWGVGSM